MDLRTANKWHVTARHPEWWVDSLVGRMLSPADTVVVTGFWRSGTTWLLQSLARALRAKSVFEPFFHGLETYRAALCRDADPPYRNEEYLNMYMPYCGSHFDGCSNLKAYTRASLTGTLAGPWVRTSRSTNHERDGRRLDRAMFDLPNRIRSSLRSRVVTKFVRAHLLILTLQEVFSPTIIHIRRDPRAVAASMQRLDWEWYKELSLEEQLLTPNDGRQDYFQSWSDQIRRYDAAPPLVRVAAYWAFVERFVDDLTEHPSRTVISYEALCRRPSHTMRKEIRPLLSGQVTEECLRENGAAPTRDRDRVSVQERVSGWKDKLDTDTAQEIESACEEVGGPLWM